VTCRLPGKQARKHSRTKGALRKAPVPEAVRAHRPKETQLRAETGTHHRTWPLLRHQPVKPDSFFAEWVPSIDAAMPTPMPAPTPGLEPRQFPRCHDAGSIANEAQNDLGSSDKPMKAWNCSRLRCCSCPMHGHDVTLHSSRRTSPFVR
jgi:hypothetical protein